MRYTPGPDKNVYTQINEASMIQSGLREQWDKKTTRLQKHVSRNYVDPYFTKTQQQWLANGFILYKALETKSIVYSWSF
jgi:hypothetical protein